jgi:hypothetical protein
MDRRLTGKDTYNIADNDLLEYEGGHFPCGRVDDLEVNMDVFVFASPLYFYYKLMEEGKIPFDERLVKCRRWVSKFVSYNS